MPGVIREKILKEQLIPVCAPKLTRGAIPLKTKADLTHHILLHNSPDYKDWSAWSEQMGVENLSLERGQIFEVDDAALQAATAGLGVALGDLFLIRDELTAGRLIAPLGLTPIRTGNYYFSRPDVADAPKDVRAFRDWLFEELMAGG